MGGFVTLGVDQHQRHGGRQSSSYINRLDREGCLRPDYWAVGNGRVSAAASSRELLMCVIFRRSASPVSRWYR
jgi:hypothetical protein